MTDPAAAPYRNVQVGPRPLPEGTPVYTPWIWAITLSPLLTLLALLFWDVESYMSQVMGASTAPTVTPGYLFDPGYLLLQGVGVVVWLAGALFAYLDGKELKRRELDRPFHWAWAFLGGLVYVIGRSVIVRRRSGRGIAPMWVGIALAVASFVIATWVSLAALSSAFESATFGP
ncbi:hypothetical protein [Marisediminicola senii]|uniref:hypothetical protein n=1 Tax=Marisediminicola senii TaxID=2711233 RepID=UPI0013ECE370|nr:hypothetical protein [Marisediminicola senii]